MKLLIVSLSLVLSLAQAATIGIIDSGVDHSHEAFANHLWVNPNALRDSRYPGMVYGWNFVDNNALTFDPRFLNYFSEDVKTYKAIESRAMLFQATESEMSWLSHKSGDAKFMADVGAFGNWIHGTHVAGIVTRNSNHQIVPLLILKTRVNSHSFIQSQSSSVVAKINSMVTMTARELGTYGSFMQEHNIPVANGSFGLGINQARRMIDDEYVRQYRRFLPPAEGHKLAVNALATLIAEARKVMLLSSEVLWVFAAGNEGKNNDEIPSHPANINMPNTITVAATAADLMIAPFSNYGVKTVDVAAPGVLVNSAIPGNGYLKLSGTSQAAPMVASIAGKMKDANPELKPRDLKKILMETVDKKEFLRFRVASGGMVNEERAIYAAQLSRIIPVDAAIERALAQVKDQEVLRMRKMNMRLVKPTPMPSSL